MHAKRLRNISEHFFNIVAEVSSGPEAVLCLGDLIARNIHPITFSHGHTRVCVTGRLGRQAACSGVIVEDEELEKRDAKKFLYIETFSPESVAELVPLETILELCTGNETGCDTSSTCREHLLQKWIETQKRK